MQGGVRMRRQALTFGVAVLVGLAALGVLASAGTAHPAAGARAADDPEMIYHTGGTVMLHNTIYVVWWDGGVGFNPGADQTAYEDRVQTFLSNLQGTTYYHILSQYYETDVRGDNKQFIGPYTKYGGSWTDTTPPDVSDNEIGAGDVQASIQRAKDANNWPSGLSTIYVVFTPQGYSDCYSSLGCSPPAGNDFCGYHAIANLTDSPNGPHVETPYVAIPPPSNDISKCGAHYTWSGGSTNDLWVQSTSTDASINAMSHEVFEAITDPDPTSHPAWYDSTGVKGEIGDKCVGQFDPFWNQSGHDSAPGSDNQSQEGTYSLGGQNFVIQEEWTNSDERCTYDDTGINQAGPNAPTVTAKTQDGSDYTFGTWTNQTVNLTVHAADSPGGLGISDIKVFTDAPGDTGTDYPYTSDADGYHVSTEPFAYRVEGTDGFTVQDSDYHGGSVSSTPGAIYQDFTAPQLFGNPTTSPNANGWYRNDVTIHWACFDGLGSGVGSSCPTDSTISGEGSGLTASASVSDLAGNQTSANSSAVNIDKTAPTVSVSAPSPAHGTNGWFDAQDSFPVQVGVSGGDPGGSGVDSFSCTVDGESATVSSGTVAVSGDGTHTVSCTSTDKAGNTSLSPSTTTVDIDTTAPTSSCGSADGAWHASDVSIGCTASDGGSGLANAGDSSFNLSTSVASGTETSNASTGSHPVCDAAGNCVTDGPIAGNKIDRKAPVVLCEGPDGAWHSDNVTLLCSGGDGGSGLAVRGDSSFGVATSVPAGSEDGNAPTGSHQVCDNVGNCSTGGPVAGNKIDRKAPSVGISFPGGSGTASSPAVLAAPGETIAFSATDGGSGVTSWTLTRYAAALSGGSCPGSFAVDAVVGGSSGGSSLTDPEALAYGKCYYWTLAATDAVGNGSTTFTSGVVRLPKLAPSPAPLAFGSVQHGTAKKLTETFSNASSAQLKVTAVSIAGSAFHVVTGGTCTVGKVVAPFGSCTVSVTFTPSSKSSYTGTLTVAGGGDAIAVSLTGTGT